MPCGTLNIAALRLRRNGVNENVLFPSLLRTELPAVGLTMTISFTYFTGKDVSVGWGRGARRRAAPIYDRPNLRDWVDRRAIYTAETGPSRMALR
jgi:hypothetical protein